MGENSMAKTRFRQLGEAQLACRFEERLRGKLGDVRSVRTVCVLLPCCAIHTVGMGYPLDIAFVGEGDRVLRSKRNVPPGRYLRCTQARYVLERAAEPQRAWLEPGERVLWRIDIEEKRSA